LVFLGNKIYKLSIFENRIIYSKVDKGKLSERIGRKVKGLKQSVAMAARLPAFFV